VQLQCMCPLQTLYLKWKLELKGMKVSLVLSSFPKYQITYRRSKKKLNIFNLNNCSMSDENYWVRVLK